MRNFVSVVLTLALSVYVGLSMAFAQPPTPAPPGPLKICLPNAIQMDVGSSILRCETNGKRVKWSCRTPGCQVYAYFDNQAIFVAPKPGVYEVLAWTAQGDEPSDLAFCTISVGQQPDPGPGPPPGPTPPNPLNPFVKPLQDAYDAAKTEPNRSKHLAALAKVYKAAGTHALNAANKTVLDLLRAIRNEVSVELGEEYDAAVVPLRKAIAAIEAKVLPTRVDAPLDDKTRKAAADIFAQVADALTQLK